ncbi:MAG: SEL1-like repeat protein, partial [Erysipelotrichaceae bacterium]|nr:SEL1-like repeat protein [Erysipelotrichaceae bacterium]
ALDKSKLFAMVVTPNLINEVNYVMTTEYPMAVKAEKRILPMELVETDKNELKEKYEGIPECTDAKDKPALSKSLLEAVQEVAIKEGDSSNEHLFFIGLAYLGGIDVEIDAKRALKLIKEAAEQELPEAIAKLVAMYNTGDGVKRDCFTAIEWQKRLVELRKKQYELDETEEKIGRYYRALRDLYDYLFDARKIEDAYEIALRMERLSNEMELKFESHDSLNNLAISYNCLGRVIEEKGNITEALEWYQKAMMAREVLAKGIRLASDRQSLSFSYDHLGEVYEQNGRLLEAKVWYEKALVLREEIVEEVHTIRSRRDLSYSYNHLGAVARAEGNFLEAKKWYEKSFEITKAIAEETNTSESKEDLSACY